MRALALLLEARQRAVAYAKAHPRLATALGSALAMFALRHGLPAEVSGPLIEAIGCLALGVC